MGNWFENMEPMDIQEERAKTKATEEKLGEAEKNCRKHLQKEIGNVIVTKVNGDTNSFKVVKTVNGVVSDDLGNIELPNQIIVKFLD